MYAIINIKTNEWLFGTDYNCSPPKQRTSKDYMETFYCLEQAIFEFRLRQCSSDYAIVEIYPQIKNVIKTQGDKYTGK